MTLRWIIGLVVGMSLVQALVESTHLYYHKDHCLIGYSQQGFLCYDRHR